VTAEGTEGSVVLNRIYPRGTGTVLWNEEDNKDNEEWEEQANDYTEEQFEKEIAQQLNDPEKMNYIVGTIQANANAKITQEIERQVTKGDLVNHLLTNLTQRMYKEITSKLTSTFTEITNRTMQLEEVSQQLQHIEEQLATAQTKLEMLTKLYSKLQTHLKKTSTRITEEWNHRKYMREQELNGMITIKQNKVLEAMDSTMIKTMAKFEDRQTTTTTLSNNNAFSSLTTTHCKGCKRIQAPKHQQRPCQQLDRTRYREA
jgi:uncharacterized membrane-anchored protein YhcB (DUF1043 family)